MLDVAGTWVARARDRPTDEHESENKGSESPSHCTRVGARRMPRGVLVRIRECTGDGSAPVVIARPFGITARRRGNRGGSMSQTTRGVFVAAVLLVAAAPGRGDEPPAIRLAEVIEEARVQNPEIKAARARAQAASYVPAQASAYDDPVFSYETWNAPESFDVTRADNNILRLSQKVPFPGKRTLAGPAAEPDPDVPRREADMVQLEVIAAVKRAYWDLWLVHENLLVYSRDKDLVERLASIAGQKYAVGQVSQPDVRRAQVELTRLINRVTTQTLGIDAAAAELNTLLSRPAASPLGFPEDPPVPRLVDTAEALTDRALENRPEPLAAAAAVAREDEKVRMARLDYLPDFELAV